MPLVEVQTTWFGARHVRRYLHESPATEQHLAGAVVRNHRLGVNNPKARMRCEITMEQALNTPTVVTPFRLDVCARQRDGAAAPVVAEDLGFAEKANGYTLPMTELTTVGGALPVSLSGSLKAKGHTPCGTGVAQCVELLRQFWGGARIAPAHNIGGPTAVSAVALLERPGGSH